MKTALRPQVTQALDELGETPEEIAATIGGRGIRGFRDDAAFNPLAQVIRGVVGTDADIEVHASYLQVSRGLDFITVELSQVAQDFLFEFQHELHSTLDIQAGEIR